MEKWKRKAGLAPQLWEPISYQMPALRFGDQRLAESEGNCGLTEQ